MTKYILVIHDRGHLLKKQQYFPLILYIELILLHSKRDSVITNKHGFLTIIHDHSNIYKVCKLPFYKLCWTFCFKNL